MNRRATSKSGDGLVVFSYDYPHRKTCDFLETLSAMGIRPSLVLAAPWIEFEVEDWRQAERSCVGSSDLTHPRLLCRRNDTPYEVADHNGSQAWEILQEIRPVFGLIAGARILSSPVVSTFEYGILNVHPGILPQSRGLDATRWALLERRPVGVTAHLIDDRIDAGRIIAVDAIDVKAEDSVSDVVNRVFRSQSVILPRALQAIRSNPRESFRRLEDDELGPLRKRMPKSIADSVRVGPGDSSGGCGR